jgi:hypothetical protein
MYPAGNSGPGRGKSRKQTAAGRRPPDPGLRVRRFRVGAGFELEGRHLVLLVTDAQREVMQGAAVVGVGAVVKWLERRYVAVPPHKHRRCTGQVVGQLLQRAAAVLCLVEVCSAALSVLENCPRKNFEGNSGE